MSAAWRETARIQHSAAPLVRDVAPGKVKPVASLDERARLCVCTHQTAEQATVVLQALGLIPYRGGTPAQRTAYGKIITARERRTTT